MAITVKPVKPFISSSHTATLFRTGVGYLFCYFVVVFLFVFLSILSTLTRFKILGFPCKDPLK